MITSFTKLILNSLKNQKLRSLLLIHSKYIYNHSAWSFFFWQNHQERHENSQLRAENDRLRAENHQCRASIAKAICHRCGGKTAIGEMSFEEHHLLLENTKLAEEVRTYYVY